MHEASQMTLVVGTGILFVGRFASTTSIGMQCIGQSINRQRRSMVRAGSTGPHDGDKAFDQPQVSTAEILTSMDWFDPFKFKVLKVFGGADALLDVPSARILASIQRAPLLHTSTAA